MSTILFFVVLQLQVYLGHGIQNQVDLFLLEENQYCQVKYECYQDESMLINTLESNHFISFSDQVCAPTLIVKDLKELINGDLQYCAPDNQFIKNPNITYLFLNNKNQNQESILKNFSCKFHNAQESRFYNYFPRHFVLV